MIALRETENGLILTVSVQPRASRAEIAGLHQNTLKIRLTAPPVGGAANKQCIELLAKALGRPKSTLAIVSGETSRRKQVLIRAKEGRLTPREADEIRQKLGTLLGTTEAG